MSGASSADTPQPGIAPELIAAARERPASALGQLLELCRAYLHTVARNELPADLQAKIDASDVVQQTFLEAHQDFAAFRGTTESELLAWLCQILRHNVANVTRQFRDTEMRQLDREQSLEGEGPAELDLAALSSSPSSHARANENADRLAVALARLPDDQRQVLHLRHQERLSFGEIGQRMGRSAEAIRKVWARAIDRLREELNPPHESG